MIVYGFWKNNIERHRERAMRIELTLPAWKAGVLPLNYARVKIYKTIINLEKIKRPELFLIIFSKAMDI